MKNFGEWVMRMLEGGLWWAGLLASRRYPPKTEIESDLPTSKAELLERLRISDDDLIKVMYDAVLNLSQRDEQRIRDTDAKAGTLIAQGATIGTLMVTAAGLLIREILSHGELEDSLTPVAIAVLLAIGAVMTSLILAVRAAGVRADWSAVNENAFFCKEILDKRQKIEAEYRRYMIVHLWDIYRRNYLLGEVKGRRLALAQRLLFFYLAFIGGAALLLIVGGIKG